MPANGSSESLSWLAEQSLVLGSQLYARLLSRAWADEGFRRLLLTRPAEALALELEGPTNEQVQVRVIEERPGQLVLVLPPNPFARGRP